jgi:hypothetical protein
MNAGEPGTFGLGTKKPALTGSMGCGATPNEYGGTWDLWVEHKKTGLNRFNWLRSQDSNLGPLGYEFQGWICGLL